MTTQTPSSVTELLSVIATSKSRLADFARFLRSIPAVTAVTQWFDCPKLESGARIEQFVDAELESGKALSWYLGIEFLDHSWRVEADIRLNDEVDQRVLARIAEDQGEDHSELAESIRSATELLTEASTAIRLMAESGQAENAP